MSKLVEDDIPNPLLQWAPDNTLRGGELTKVEDPLLARDTWINQLFVGHNLQSASYKVQTKINYVRFRQLMSEARRQALELDEQDFFFGVINKASYRYALGRLSVEPRWKSEFRKQSRSLFALEHSTSLYELFSAVVETRLLRATQLQAGVEYLIFNDFDVDANDFNSITGAVQFTNQSQYLGYSLHALAGLRIERQDFKEREARYTSQTFITIYAGLE